MTAEFHISDWDRETILLEVAVVDPSPDGKDENVFCATVNGQYVYFEAPVDSELGEILEIAVEAVKELIDYERF